MVCNLQRARSAVKRRVTEGSCPLHPLKRSALAVEFEKSPARVLRRAVARMLPRNKQRQPRMHRLTIVGEKGTKRIW